MGVLVRVLDRARPLSGWISFSGIFGTVFRLWSLHFWWFEFWVESYKWFDEIVAGRGLKLHDNENFIENMGQGREGCKNPI